MVQQITLDSTVNTGQIKMSGAVSGQEQATAAYGQGTLSNEQIEESVDKLQKHLAMMKETQFQLEFDKDIDRIIVKYISSDSGEVVSQIPTEKFVNWQKEFVKTIGLLFDQTV